VKTTLGSEKISKELLIFSIIIVVLFILRSRPFMQIPYDIWHHLMIIVSIHDTGEAFTFIPVIKESGVLWHYFWGYFFRLLPTNDVFIWAKIIHVLQSMFAFACYFAFSDQAFVLLFRDVPRSSLRLLAFLATVLWVLGTGTYSIIYQQAWIQWYSVNYQGFTLPLYWLGMSQLLLVAYGDLPWRAVMERTIILIFFFLIILLVHPMESLYFAITVGIILLTNLSKIISFSKQHPLKILMAVFLVTILPLTAALVAKELSLIRFPRFLMEPSIPLLKAIFVDGGRAVVEQGLNRGWTAFSEMAFFCFCCAPLLWVMVILKKRKSMISYAVLFFLTIHTLVFFLIPRIFWMAGIASILTDAIVVHRFNFICSAFVFLPALLFLIFENHLWHSLQVFLACLTAAVVCLFLSQTIFHGTFYRNAQSLWKSLELCETDRVGIQFSKQDLKWLERIYLRSLPPDTGKPLLFYVRGDVAPLFRTVFRQMVFANRRDLRSREEFLATAKALNFTPVEVDLPEDYPKDVETFLYFALEKH
jgi:hypothetical protein